MTLQLPYFLFGRNYAIITVPATGTDTGCGVATLNSNHSGEILKMLTKFFCAIISVLCVVCLLASCSTTSQITSGNSNQCINVVNHGYPVAGTPLRVKPCDPWRNQQWSISNGQFTGVGGFCVDVQGSAAVDGASVIYVPCSGSPSQMWTSVNGTIVGIGGKCIDVGRDAQAWPPLIMAPCNGSPSQMWVLR